MPIISDAETIVVHPDRLYDVHEVARILSPSKPLHRDVVYRIPESLLRKTRVGARRGLTRWKGRDILAYLDSGS